MRIFYENLLKLDEGTFTATNADANYPLEDTLDNTMQTVFQATTSTSVITRVFTQDQSISGVCVGNTNATQISVIFRNASNAIVYQEIISGSQVRYSGSFPGNIIYTGEITNVRSIEFSCAGQDPFYIGGLWVGQYLQMPYFNTEPVLGFVSSSSSQKTRGGVTFTVSGTALRALSCTFDSIRITDFDAINAFYRLVQKSNCFWVDVWEESDEFAPLFCQLTNDISYTKGISGIIMDALNLEFEECK